MNDEQPVITENVTVSGQFPCPIYIIDRPDFLNDVQEVSEEYLKKSHENKQLNEIYPHLMTETFHHEMRVKLFGEYILNMAWNILDDQGYDMQHFATIFQQMWTQEHHKQSLMEQHVHGYGSQIVGFYFLEVPEGSSKIVFHDPRPGKVMVDLPQKDVNQATPASQMINFEPKPGRFVFSNTWLPHSFTRHAGENPLKFVHFNVSVVYNNAETQICRPAAAEVV